LKLDADGDLDLSNGKNAMWICDADAIAQQVTVRLRMHRGEWFADLDLGVDYDGQVFGPGRTEDQVGSEIRRAILGVPGVSHLTSFAVKRNGNAVAVTFSAKTDDGQTMGPVSVEV
jgi:hypothetical protein